MEIRALNILLLSILFTDANPTCNINIVVVTMTEIILYFYCLRPLSFGHVKPLNTRHFQLSGFEIYSAIRRLPHLFRSGSL